MTVDRGFLLGSVTTGLLFVGGGSDDDVIVGVDGGDGDGGDGGDDDGGIPPSASDGCDVGGDGAAEHC